MYRSNGGSAPGPAFVALLALLVANDARAGASEYLLPLNGDNVIGVVTTAVAEHEDTLLDIGRRHGVGYEEIIAANPGIDPWLPGAGTEIVIPGRFILPDAPREGIVVNLPEHRLYYFPPARPGEPRIVRTYPISTGKMDWKTPLGVTRVVSKQERPNWNPPESVRLEHIAKGDPLPKVVPPGPDNPLGEYAMRAVAQSTCTPRPAVAACTARSSSAGRRCIGFCVPSSGAWRSRYRVPRDQPTFVVWSIRFTCVLTGTSVKNSAMSSGNMRMQPCVTCMPTPAGRLVPWIR
jgi:lipoprotein-anchoring transpeptidase ErfK/SrfK